MCPLFIEPRVIRCESRLVQKCRGRWSRYWPERYPRSHIASNVTTGCKYLSRISRLSSRAAVRPTPTRVQPDRPAGGMYLALNRFPCPLRGQCVWVRHVPDEELGRRTFTCKGSPEWNRSTVTLRSFCTIQSPGRCWSKTRRNRPDRNPARTIRWLRVRLAQALVNLAVRIEPGIPVLRRAD
jgi:hypothetical protein